MRIISPLLAFICCLPASVTAIELPPSIAIQLADRYLQSFVEEVKPVPEAKKPKILDASITTIHLSPRAVRAVVFNEIFAKSGYYQERYQQVDKVLNPYVWNDLHLFCGTTTTPTYHFLSRINRTITVLGEGALASLLGAPIANLETLSKRQQFINFLSKNNQIYADLKSQLVGYKGAEKGMLSFWTKTDPLYTKEYDKYLTGLFYTSSATSNKSASALQTKKILLRDIWNIYSNYIWYPLIGLPITEIYYQISSAFDKNNKYTSRGDFYSKIYWDYMPVYNLYHIGTPFSKDKKPASTSEKLSRSLNSIKPSRYLNATIVTAHSLFQYYKGYANYKEYTAVLKNLALRMADLQTFLMTAKKINALVQETAALEAMYGEQLRPIRDLLARLNEPSEEGKLLRYLDQLPFRSWSYLFDHAGKLLASYKLFLEHKALFHDAMYAVGELDALVSIATLMWEGAASDGAHGYTFTKFLSPQAYTQPRLTLTQMWNPMLSPTTAIGNDVTMDRATKTQTIILTGPNAGGKSTFLSGVALSVLLSQTFGIAPAKSCEMTPFSKINTYIDVTDDIAAGKSLFLAEVDRFQSHLKILEGLKKDAFSFSIFDEPFSGTNPVEGAAAEYSVLNYIAKYGNALNIVATHYPIVMLLEQREADKGFKNYKVFIKSLGKDGKIQYTYKVVPGASDQTIAIDILKEQGYGTEMLEKAREIISHPDQYKKSFSK